MNEWACPNCGARDGQHGEGECEDYKAPEVSEFCEGLTCVCKKTHRGFCYSAECRHCGWEGRYPMEENEA